MYLMNEYMNMMLESAIYNINKISYIEMHIAVREKGI